MDKRRSQKMEENYIWENRQPNPPATAKSFYLDNKDRIDNIIESIKWVAEDPKSDHGYYKGIDKLGNKYRRFPCGKCKES